MCVCVCVCVFTFIHICIYVYMRMCVRWTIYQYFADVYISLTFFNIPLTSYIYIKIKMSEINGTRKV